MKRTIPLLALTPALFIAACGGAGLDPGASTTTAPDDPTTSSTPPPTDAPPDPAALVLEVRGEGGFATADVVLGRGPRFVLYDDGSLWFEGPVPEIFPGPLAVPFQRVQLTEDQIADVLAGVEATGLPDETDGRLSADDRVADALDIVFTYVDGDGEHRMAVYALGIGDPQDPAVVPYQELDELLVTLAVSGDPETVEADRFQVIIGPSGDGADHELATVEPWPLATAYADLPDTGPHGLRCTSVSGDEADAFAAVAIEATQLTFFEDAGEVHRFTVRPLAPHEEACAAF